MDLEKGLALGVIVTSDRVVVPLATICLHDNLLFRPAEVRDRASSGK